MSRKDFLIGAIAALVVAKLQCVCGVHAGDVDVASSTFTVPELLNVGTAATPTGQFVVSGTATNQILRAGNNAKIAVGRANTSLASPAVVTPSNPLGAFQIAGWNGTTYITGAQILGTARDTFSGTINGTELDFGTADTGATALSFPMTVGPGMKAQIGMAVGTTSTIAAPTANNLQVGDAAGLFTISVGGHLRANGNNLSFAAGGGCEPVVNVPAVSLHVVLLQAGPVSLTTTCVLTFLKTYTGADDATCNVWAMGVNTVPTCTNTATTINCSVILPSQKYGYHCFGH